MSGILSETAKRLALEAMLDGAIALAAGEWTVEVELVAEWLARGSRWSALRQRRGFWREFFHPLPVVRRQTWHTERKPIRLKQTPTGFTNDSDVGFDLVGIPPVPQGSRGWVPSKANVYRGEDPMFWFDVSDFRIAKFVRAGDDISFAPHAITATLDVI